MQHKRETKWMLQKIVIHIMHAKAVHKSFNIHDFHAHEY